MSDPMIWHEGVTRPVASDELARQWMTAVHAALRASSLRWTTDGLREPGPGWNYYCVVLRSVDHPAIRLLLNAAARLVAAADDGPASVGPLRFRQVISEAVFVDAGFYVATPEMLSAPITSEQIAALAIGEREDIAYHRASTVGEMLFNWFD